MRRDKAFRRIGVRLRPLVGLAVVALLLSPAHPAVGAGGGGGGSGRGGLSPSQEANLLGIARDTWNFYRVDVDPATELPMDNLTFAGGSAAPTGYGRYTSAANIGVYLWAVVAANDLGLISRPKRGLSSPPRCPR